MKLKIDFSKVRLRFFMLFVFVVLTSCGGGGSSSPAGTNTTGNSDCVIDQSQIGSCTLG